MKNSLYVVLICLVGLFANCKSKKTKVVEGEKVEIADFIGLYEEAKLPLTIADSVFQQKNADTIPFSIFVQFVPDSIIAPLFHKSKPLFIPLSKVTVKSGETYLFSKAVTAAKKAVYVTVFDEKKKFAAAKPLIIADNDKATSAYATMDTKYTLTTFSQQSQPDKEALYKRDVFIYNGSGGFTLILTESNGAQKKVEDIFNPIDTLSAKHKLAGDYVQNKKNFISFRDGRNASRMLFFVHFEKDDGSCKGELKGEAKVISDKLVRFSETGSPCVIDFTFSGKNVTMKEVGGCGSYRDIKCFFEGSFTKKVVPVKKPAKAKK